MSTAGLLSGYALHAVWQVPLLSAAAWCAVRVGRPGARAANALWTATLLLCVALPLPSTLLAWSAAQGAARDRAVSITFDPAADADGLVPLHREPAWLRMVHRHATLHEGLRPFALTMPPRWERPLAGAYLLACGAAVLNLLLAWRRMREMVARSEACTLPGAHAIAERCREHLRSPELRVSREVRGPCLAGVLRPVLLLPQSITAMTGVEVEAVMSHEMAHLRRHDPVLHMLCLLLVVPVSFHPAAWWVSGRVRQTREMACDAAAARCMQSGAAYAHALLGVAGRVQHQAAGLEVFGNGLFGAGLGLWSKQGNLEERMQMLMKSQQPVSAASRAVRLATCVTLAAAAVVAAAMVQVQPTLAAEQAAPTASPAEAGLHPPAAATDHHAARTPVPMRTAHASNPQVHVDASKLHVETAALQVKLDKLEAELNSSEWRARLDAQTDAVAKLQQQMNSPEWKAQMQRVQQVAASVAAQVNTPQFKATIEAASRVDQAKLAAVLKDAAIRRKQAMERMRSGMVQQQLDGTRMMADNTVPVLPAEASAAAGPVKVASSVMAGNALLKVQPVYPPEAKEKKIQGEVLLHAIVSEEGKVEQLSVVHSPDDLLSKSASDAVRQWTYKPYLLNGEPVAVETTITVHYSFSE